MFSKYIFFQSFTFTKPIKEFTEHLWYSGSDLLIVGSNPVTNGILYFKYYLGMYAVSVGTLKRRRKVREKRLFGAYFNPFTPHWLV